ncbi:MAG TPA: hypothetical protein VFK85_08525 [Anaeromyxobacteraceae bacterium]|nr:hypothetical protein [Anaeromyxobacteraceae bacterium]
MPRTAAAQPSIDDIVRDAMEGVVKRASAAIAKAIAEMAASRIDAELQSGVERARGRKGRGVRARTGGAASARRARGEITKWVADNRARRVPNFVIEMTGGLDTKKKIVAKYGENATFEKGKPLPRAKSA